MFDNWFNSSKTPDSCKDIGKYDPYCDTLRIMRDKAALETAMPSQKGALYEDMASQFLKAAVHQADKGNKPFTKVFLEGSDYGRNALDPGGKPVGYDGVDDLLKLSAQNGGNSDHLNKMNACAGDLKKSLDK